MKKPSVLCRTEGLYSLPDLVGAMRLEPTTPTMSRWENGTFRDVMESRFHRSNGFLSSQNSP